MSTLTLWGRWRTEAHPPGRSFLGVVEEPGPTGLRPGDPVMVTVETGGQEGPRARALGRYHLEGLPTTTFVLVSFTRQDSGSGDRAVQDDGEQLWGGAIVNSV